VVKYDGPRATESSSAQLAHDITAKGDKSKRTGARRLEPGTDGPITRAKARAIRAAAEKAQAHNLPTTT
jgi:hypothetical protein